MGKQIHVNPMAPYAPLPRWLVLLTWGNVGAAVVVLFGLWPLTGGDLWTHVTVGRVVWHTGGVPRVDVFTFASPGEFIAHSWLAELAFFLIEKAAGTVGFMVLRLTLISVALTFACVTARSLKAPWPALVLLAPVVLGVMWGRLEFRPQLFTTALLALQLWLVISVHLGHRSRHWLWWLPPLYALWINLHGGWPQGMAMLAAILAALVAMDVRHRWLGTYAVTLRHSHLPWSRLALVLVACVGALFVNPYFARLIYFPVEMQAPWIRAMAIGSEWQSPLMNLGWWNVGGGAHVPIQPIFWLDLALLGGVLLMTVKRWRTADLIPIAVMVLWLALGLRHLRAASDAVLLTAPFIAALLPMTWWRVRWWPALAGTAMILGLMAMGIWSAVGFWRDLGFHWMRDEPVCLAAMIERLNLSGRIFVSGNPRVDAGWVLYRFHPQIRVHYTWDYVAGAFYTAELRAVYHGGPSALLAYLNRYQVDTAVLSTREFHRRFLADHLPGWVFVHVDNSFVVMVREAAAQGMPVYHVIRP